MKRVLVITAVEQELAAIVRGLGEQQSHFDVLAAGVGPVAAAAKTAEILAYHKYDYVVSAGIGGGFRTRAKIGSIVLASEISFADLGSETPDGFLSVDELGFGSSQIKPDLTLVQKTEQILTTSGFQVCTGPILTVSAATGTEETAKAKQNRFTGAAAEAMEGFGVAYAAKIKGIPVMEIRTISNTVGHRDRKAWRIKEALESLEAAFAILPEVLG